jgi:transcriptional regulator with XRE-family HTH domain
MGRQTIRLSGPARDALTVLGQQVRFARQDQRLTAADLAARAGVSERTVYAIERATGTVSSGNLFNVATAAGVPLFGAETEQELMSLRRVGRDRLALLPARVYHRAKESDADNI